MKATNTVENNYLDYPIEIVKRYDNPEQPNEGVLYIYTPDFNHFIHIKNMANVVIEATMFIRKLVEYYVNTGKTLPAPSQLNDIVKQYESVEPHVEPFLVRYTG